MGRTAMSSQELRRVEVMGRVKAGSLKLNEASELLEISYRQTSGCGSAIGKAAERRYSTEVADGDRIGPSQRGCDGEC